MDKPIVLPVAPLRDGPIFQFTEVPLVFGKSKSVAALKSAADTNRLIFITGQKTVKKQNLRRTVFMKSARFAK